MAQISNDELTELVKKWAKHYGYKEITIYFNPPDQDQPYKVRLSYRNGLKYHFYAYDIATIQKKITENKPPERDRYVQVG